MSENISEHTTSITGLTCKPLAILSETISLQEMSMVRGGTDDIGNDPPIEEPYPDPCPEPYLGSMSRAMSNSTMSRAMSCRFSRARSKSRTGTG